MLLAAALISVVVADPQTPAQAPPPVASSSTTTSDSKPCTVKGVRAAVAGRPVIDYNVRERDERDLRLVATARSDRSSWWSQVTSDWQEGWSGGATPTWHQEFLAMTGQRDYGGPYYGSTNGERLVAVASSAAIGLAVAGVASALERAVVSPIHDKVVKYGADRKRKKIDNVRAEIRAELAELERLNAAARASGQTGAW